MDTEYTYEESRAMTYTYAIPGQKDHVSAAYTRDGNTWFDSATYPLSLSELFKTDSIKDIRFTKDFFPKNIDVLKFQCVSDHANSAFPSPCGTLTEMKLILSHLYNQIVYNAPGINSMSDYLFEELLIAKIDIDYVCVVIGRFVRNSK